MSGAYYNEHDKFMAEWLCNLIRAGHIADGVVDTRSISDVRPSDLRGFTQCHFFAGLGGWSLALRSAGWRDDRPVWTGSCPCQPFSAAGKGAAFADERHLWPDFDWLISQCDPAIIFGEQVASSTVDDWIDLVQADLEALGYAFGSTPFPSAGVGAPHIRDRNFWVALAKSLGQSRKSIRAKGGLQALRASNCSDVGYLADTERQRIRSEGHQSLRGASKRMQGENQQRERLRAHTESSIENVSDRMADAELQQRPDGQSRISAVDAARGRQQSAAEITGLCCDLRAGPTNGFWRDADWLFCRDGKWRPVEPSTFPLAHGLPTGMGALSTGEQRLAALAGLDAASLKRAKAHRIGGLRGAGNAINIEAARTFIETVMECMP